MDGNRRAWYQFFAKLADIRLTYGQLKADEEVKTTSTLLGGRAVFYNILFVIFMTVGVLGVIFGLKILNDDSVIVGLVILIIGIAMALNSLLQFVLATVCAIYQLRLNKRAISWITLAISLLIMIGAVVALVLGIS